MLRFRPAVLLLSLTLSIVGLAGPARASTPSEGQSIDDFLSTYDASHAAWLRSFEESSEIGVGLASAQSEVEEAGASESAAASRLEQSRSHLSRLSTRAYMSIGTDGGSSTIEGVQALATAAVRTDKRRLEAAKRRTSDAIESFDRVREAAASADARTDAQAQAVASAGDRLVVALADAGVHGTSAEDFWAATRAHQRLRPSRVAGSDCSLPLALLIAAVRSLVDHSPDHTLDPTESDRAATDFSTSLCSSSYDLTSYDGLHAAITSITHNSARTGSVLAFAHRLSRSGDEALALGRIPDDPSVASIDARIAFEARAEEGAVPELIAWSLNRLGTPYSQCLDTHQRAEDPPCPPGTDRFGNGFFDCSGFVAAAYASIGVSLPTSTEAMLDDPEFMSHRVAEAYDPAADRPGDLLLSDGHVALSLGDGTIIHASDGSLTMESLPAWVRDGVVAVVRPLTTVG